MTDTRKLFGTDGVRGVANVYPMTAEVALQLGRALAYVIKYGPGRHRIVIGKDTRISGYLLEYATVAGICSMGVDVLLLGPFPTPGIAYITSSMRADAGVVISASHNPYQDNGIKFFSGNGFKLPDELEARIEALMAQPELDGASPTATEVGQAFRIDDARGRYISFLKSTFPKELELDGLKIVVDCAHGATYRIAPEIFTELGAEVIPMGVRPNGRNINRKCGATSPEGMARPGKTPGGRPGPGVRRGRRSGYHGGPSGRDRGRRPHPGDLRLGHAEAGEVAAQDRGGHRHVESGPGIGPESQGDSPPADRCR